ncbi:uncharacterized protein LOC125648452 [Ostrea edulis]|uniref:uncharacterized protein LOC125648452 n=1 Tax=Ostrea edulis TaxID=37623 RepID=UPI0024AFCBF9|nr:uncharacterized protein LOC125648452 [Ostrea edulis]
MVTESVVSGTKKLHQKSELAVKADHVLKFMFDPEINYAQGRVQASMRHRSYHVSVTLGDNHTVSDSICDCVNGQDKCHHKASLLLYGYKNVSKTDVRASWIQHPKKTPPKKTTTMNELFPPSQKVANYRYSQKYEETLLWIVSKEPPSPTLDIPYVEDLLLGEAYTRATDKIQWLKTNLAIQREKIEQVAQLTVGQRNNHLWALVRKNRLTASNFGKVLAAIRRNRFPPSLFKQVLGSYDLLTKDVILWGINNESVAKAKYCSHGDAVVEETGVWLLESGVLGLSPDGVIRRAATHKYNHQVAQLTEILETMKLMPEIL